ncbi:hypothetical protein V6N11_027978 [Hibiscus sabdariffa]|uniref:Uncharacterized protein n=2 Tax=Hibiscus sabdariffa TaxID=183260 RepID=A0ABR2NZD5_9ROSI
MAVEIFISSGWAREVPLVLCMNCKIILSWLENPMQYSWGLAMEIVEIMCLLRNLSDYRLQLIDREENGLASTLAREGLNKESCFKAWWTMMLSTVVGMVMGNGSQVIVVCSS